MERISSSIFSSEYKELKRLVIKILWAVLPLLILVGGANFLLDPAHVYARDMHYEKGLADILLSGKNAANVTNYNQRLVQKFFIAGMKAAPEVAVIGSSRAMQIGANIFPEVSVVNNSVTGAVLGDLLGILFNYDKKGVLPKKIILGVDSWTLNSGSVADWEVLREDAFAMLKKMGPMPWKPKRPLISERLSNLFSLTYFQGSMRRLLKRDFISDRYFPTEEQAGSYTILLKDGSRSYDQAYRSKSVQTVRLEVKEALQKGYVDGCELGKPDAAWVNVFERMVIYLKSRKIDVVLFLAPIHPDVYKSFMESPRSRIIVDIERLYREIAQKYDVKVVGSYDPARCGLTEADFYDAGHATKEAVEKLFK